MHATRHHSAVNTTPRHLLGTRNSLARSSATRRHNPPINAGVSQPVTVTVTDTYKRHRALRTNLDSDLPGSKQLVNTLRCSAHLHRALV